MLTRRAFLQIAFGALAAGMILSPEVAKAIEMAPPDKYTKAFVLARDITATTLHYTTDRKTYEQKNYGKRMPLFMVNRNTDFLKIQQDANTLFDLFNNEFECSNTPKVLLGIKDIMEGRSDYDGLIFDADNETYARQLLETIFTMTVTRDIIKKTNAPLHPKMSPAFTIFAKGHRDLIYFSQELNGPYPYDPKKGHRDLIYFSQELNGPYPYDPKIETYYQGYNPNSKNPHGCNQQFG